jgi:hypothetical protein
MDAYFIFVLSLIGLSYCVGYYFGEQKGYTVGIEDLIKDLSNSDHGKIALAQLFEDYSS